ncbi:unnamed protein product [Microthlaspi erraticum]|uniref:Uncharacterized protein n=1 Tax=Microthlaspi erraticum TaxID=1685480 RepID=A0A6D2KCN8_9BRAS|nr:unnamed protein product [Microthlaspi erraticum]
MAAAALSAQPNRLSSASDAPLHPLYLPSKLNSLFFPTHPWRSAAILLPTRRRCAAPRASSRADDSPPFDMSVETALKVLGVSEGASFDEILRAKKSILASRKDDPNAISQAEAAYDMLLMQSLNQRRAGKVVSNNIRYADVKTSTPGRVSQWMKNPPVSLDMPSTSNLGIQAGVYGAMMALTYVNGSSESSGIPYAAADVPGLILATSFGASLYFMTKRNVKLGKAAAITAGGLVAGAVVGSTVESWLHVDVVPLLGLHSPAALVSEFIVFSQFLVSLYLR